MAVEVRYIEEAEMFFQAYKQGRVSEEFITTLCQELDDLGQDESFGSFRQAADNMARYLTSRVVAERSKLDPPAKPRRPRLKAVALS